MNTDHQPTTASRRFVLAAGALVVLGLAVAAIWWLTGGRWMIVATPSMGRAAPVGTLVFTEHVSAAQVHVGDIISFHSPINPAQTYTHRVVSIDVAGGLHTKGDINGGNDPATLHDADLIGKVVARWWGIGWLLRALPFLLVGGLVLWFATRRWVSAQWRAPIRVFGGSLLIAIAGWLLRPFVNMVQFASVQTAHGVDLTLVSTGLLPIRVTGTGGDHVDLIDGQIGAVAASGTPGPHGYQFTSAVHMSWGWWIVVGLIWLVPLLIGLLLGPRAAGSTDLPPPGDDGSGSATADADKAADVDAILEMVGGRTSTAIVVRPRGAHRARPERRSRRAHPATGARRVPRTVAAVLTIGLTALAGLIPSTESAFAAKVLNSTNTAASNPYFTCKAAAVSTTANGGFFAYPMIDASGTSAADTSGNSRTGTYVGTWNAAASGPCSRDTAGAAVAGGTQSYISTPTVTGLVTDPEVFSLEIWFKTSTAGGRLIGFGSAQTGTSGQYDRHIFMTDAGKLVFGVYPGAVRIITSAKAYNDNVWHQTVATLSSAGMRLYVDGALVASDTATTSAEVHAGWWRVGYDNLNSWTSQPTNFNYLGSLAWASVYTTALPAITVASHYAAGL